MSFERYRREVAELVGEGADAAPGCQRLDDQRLRVTVLSRVSGCNAQMIHWWMGYMRTPSDYRLWHPEDHEWMDWDEDYVPAGHEASTSPSQRGDVGRYVGATQLVHERIGGRLQKLRIHFLDPAEVLPGPVSGVDLALCGRTGMLQRPLDVGWLVHLVSDTEDGCHVRSRFWLGDVGARDPRYVASAWLANRGPMRRRLAPGHLGEDLERHCREEMQNLSTFLPELWADRH